MTSSLSLGDAAVERPRTMSPEIPEHGTPHDELLTRIAEIREGDARWQDGKTFSLVYHAGDEHSAMLKDVYTTFFSENALNPIAFQSLRRFEADVVRMTATMLGGGPEVAGTMTSGGSESIMMCMKTARDWARAERPEITAPEIILPTTAHPAFDKACHYFDLTIVRAGLADDLRVDVSQVRDALSDNTIAIVGSAPGYPHGIIDPIEDLAAIAHERDILMHVDGCLGGFLLPWVEALGHPIPPFDFRVEGVTSMSADIHKYGFAAKGASIVLYRDAALRQHQFFAATGWPGGLYVSPTAAGTRPGGAIAAAWAALHAMGREGYLKIAEDLMGLSQRLQDGIDAVPGLRVLGDPAMTVFAYTSDDDDVDIFAVGDALERRGWSVDRLIRPEALHLMLMPTHLQIEDAFLSDIAEAVDEVRGRPELSTEGQAALYGMMAKVPEGDEQATTDFVKQMLGGLYETE